MPRGVYPKNEKSTEAKRANGILAGLNFAKKTIDRNLMIWSDIKKMFGKKEFSVQDVEEIIARHKLVANCWLSTHSTNRVRHAFLCFLKKSSSSAHYYVALDTPILKNKSSLLPQNIAAIKKVFGNYEIIDSIIDASIEYHNKEKEITMKAERKAVTEEEKEAARDRICGIGVEKKSRMGVTDLISMFHALTNIEKTDIACLLNPLLDKGSVLAKYNEIYPNYAMPNVKRGDVIFHPIAGKKEVVEADEKFIYFYGNGNRWKCDRDGYIDGDHSKPRSVWTSFDSYAKEMNR